MASKQQKEELMQTLRFTPRTYTLNISGYGGETYAGVVDRKIYDFFKSKNIDINQYAWPWDEDLWRDIPDDLQPFSPGNAYDCDSIFHMSGAELVDSTYITVSDENSDTHWESQAGYADLESAGVNVECSACNEIADQDSGTVVFWGGAGEKGCFFEGEIELRAPFDPAKLTIYYEDCDGWCLISTVEYDGEELDGSNGYGTTGKWNEAKWIIVDSEEEVYEGVEREDGYCDHLDNEELSDAGVSAFSSLVQAIADSKLVDVYVDNWNSPTVKPTAKGEYLVKFAAGTWPSGDERVATWTGRSWRENDKRAPEMIGWRKVEGE